MKKIYALLAMMAFGQTINAQIVNIEDKRIDEDRVWTGAFELNLETVKDAQDVFQLENRVHLQYHKNANTVLFMNDLTVNKSDEESWQNNGFQHLRYMYFKEDSFWGIETYLQHQYNEVRKIDLRFLAGVGFRFKCYKSEKLSLFVGTSAMHNYEEELTGLTESKLRSSNYLTCTWEINDQVSFRHTSYFQPVFDDLDDYRYAGESGLSIELSERLSFGVDFNLLYDSDPAEDIPELTYQLQNGIVYNL